MWQGITALNRSFSRLVAFFESDPHSAAALLPYLYHNRMNASLFYEEILDLVSDSFPIKKSARTEPAKVDKPAERLREPKTVPSEPPKPLVKPTVAAVKPIVAPKGSDDEDSDDSSEPGSSYSPSCGGCSTCSGPRRTS